MAITFDPVAFREEFPAFQCTPPIADAPLQAYFDTAILYISNNQRCGNLTQAQREQCIYLMTAHLAAISRAIYEGQTIGILTNATVDKVTVTLEPPPAQNQWEYWLQSTPYGQQLLALLQVAAVGGFYVGGRPVLATFRR